LRSHEHADPLDPLALFGPLERELALVLRDFLRDESSSLRTRDVTSAHPSGAGETKRQSPTR